MGIDLGDKYIHILALTHDKTNPCVLAYLRADLPQDAINFGVIQDISAVTQIMQDLLRSMPRGAARVVLAMPDGLLLQTELTVNSSLSLMQIESFVNMSVTKNLSTKMHVDFEILAESAQDQRMHAVRVYASHARDVQQRLDLLRSAGLKIHIMDIKSHAIARALCFVLHQETGAWRKQTIALIEFDTISISFYVLHEMCLIFMEIKLLSTHAVASMHDVEHVFQLFYASEYAREINHLLLSGNATDLPCMAHVLSTRLNLPAAIINPLAYLDFADDRLRELMDINAPQLLAALGLALR